jgi:hypothetical protein
LPMSLVVDKDRLGGGPLGACDNARAVPLLVLYAFVGRLSAVSGSRTASCIS